MTVHLRRLQVFVLVAETGRFSDAAHLLGMSQPAVSQAMKNLEQELGLSLINRGQGGQLTEAGQVLYEKAKAILQLWSEVEQKFAEWQDSLRGRLLVGASSIPGSHYLPKMVADFCKDHPGVTLAMEVGDSAEIIEKVRQRQVDVAMVGLCPEDEHLEMIPFARDQLLLITPPEHPLANRQGIGPDDLRRQTFVMRERGSGTRKAMEECLSRCGLRSHHLNRVIEVNSSEALLRAVEAGLGLSFVSDLAARPALREGRVTKADAVCGPFRRTFYLTCHTQRKEEPLVREFILFATRAGGGGA